MFRDDRFDVLVPEDRLSATGEPHRVPIARCECGTYGCSSTDVTSTEASTLVGLTPSATSYHMNVLKRWGIAVQEPPGKDGRQRPWRAASDDLRIAPAADVARVAQSLGATMFLGGLNAAVEAWAAQPKTAGAGLVRGRVWLTDDEARALNAEIGKAVDRLCGGRTSIEHPDGATAREYAWAQVPARGP